MNDSIDLVHDIAWKGVEQRMSLLIDRMYAALHPGLSGKMVRHDVIDVLAPIHSIIMKEIYEHK